MTANRLSTAIFTCGCLLFATAAANAQGITIENAWIREAPPTASVLAAFFRLQNDTNSTLTLEGGESSYFSRVELHETSIENGVASMKKVNQLTIDTGESIIANPGGYHLMLIDPSRAFAKGDDIPITLRFKNGPDIEFTASVRKQQPSKE